MAERFNILQTLESKQLSTDDPSVQICAARILEDNKTGQKYLQVKFANNGEQTITGLDITVKSGDIRIAIQHFTDLNLKYGETSGSKTLIAIPAGEESKYLNISVSKIRIQPSPSVIEEAVAPPVVAAPPSTPAVKGALKKATGLSPSKILPLLSAVLLLLCLLLSVLENLDSLTYIRTSAYGEDGTASALKMTMFCATPMCRVRNWPMTLQRRPTE